MYIEVVKNKGVEYIRLVQSRRIKNPDGKSLPSKKVICTLGKLSKYDDKKPDYVKRLKQSFKDGTPIIEELLPYTQAERKTVKIPFTMGDESCIGTPKYLAPCILDNVFAALGLNELFASIKFSSKIEYDLQGIVRLLTFGRILDPASKLATMHQNNNYYRPLVKSSNEDNVYDALDVIYNNKRQIFQRINTNISNTIGRNLKNVFYDVTNFFFENEQPDEDVLDADGKVIEKGLRKKGVSKENRKQPIVQVGLFLDDNGIPISIEMFPGNTLDHLTLRDAMKNTVDTLGLNRFILIADRGMYSGPNTCHVLDQQDGYIVSKSIKKSKKKEREWILDQEGYIVEGENFKYKSRIVERVVTDENGEKRKLKEKVIVYWSRKFYERERTENKNFIEFIEKLKTNPHNFRITAAQSSSLRKFLKKEVIDKKSGEVLDGSKLISMIDEEKLSEFNELMGYYQIVTSEIDMHDTEIIDRYHGLTRIEDQFREMKGTLETRPIYLQTPEHIKAHLIVCFMALTMIRIMQHKIKKCLPQPDDSELNWSYGITGEKLVQILSDWKVDALPYDYYRMTHSNIDDLKLLFNAFEMPFEMKLFSSGDLRKLKSSVKIL